MRADPNQARRISCPLILRYFMVMGVTDLVRS